MSLHLKKALLIDFGWAHYILAIVVEFLEFVKIRQPIWRSIALLSNEQVTELCLVVFINVEPSVWIFAKN